MVVLEKELESIKARQTSLEAELCAGRSKLKLKIFLEFYLDIYFRSSHKTSSLQTAHLPQWAKIQFHRESRHQTIWCPGRKNWVERKLQQRTRTAISLFQTVGGEKSTSTSTSWRQGADKEAKVDHWKKSQHFAALKTKPRMNVICLHFHFNNKVKVKSM